MIWTLDNFCHPTCPACSRTVLVTGCFDVIHCAHVRLIERAALLGREVIMGINSDESVRRLKPGRPINNEMDRANVLMAIKGVRKVIIFNEPTVTRLINVVRPSVWVKGGDYTLETLNQDEVAAARKYGRIELVPHMEGYSTTKIIERMKR